MRGGMCAVGVEVKVKVKLFFFGVVRTPRCAATGRLYQVNSDNDTRRKESSDNVIVKGVMSNT